MELSAVMVPLTKPINKDKIYLELTICLLTNQTSQQRQDLTANICNTQLYTFITIFAKIQNSFKNRKNDDRNIKEH